MFSKKSVKLAVWLGLALFLMTITMEAKTTVTKQPFGKTSDGTPVDIYTLSDGTMEARIMTYGGIVVSLKVPDRNGKQGDVVLGFDSLEPYFDNTAYFGAIVGRYGNRIAGGTFKLDGKTYTLPKNNGNNTLHGGTVGFNKAVWNAKEIPNGIELTHLSKDGDQGFPGNLNTTVRYTVTGSELRIEYSATTDKDTVVNLTNHSYFNLAGQGNGDILKDVVKINASRFTPTDAQSIPTGELKPVKGTPFDFLSPHAVGERIDADDPQLHSAHGYDHNWVLDSGGGKMAEAAEVYEPTTGRVLQVLTDEPGVQFYTANALALRGPMNGKDGKTYNRRSALCLETQHFPDSPNHPDFPSTELKPGKRYHTVTVFKFSTR